MDDPNSMPPRRPPARIPKFNAMEAWNAAMAAIRTNRETLIVIAGLFFLLPQLVVSFVIPEPPADTDPDELLKVMAEIVGDYWWLLTAFVVIQAIGTLCVIILLSDRARPTVGDAIGRAAKLMPIAFAAQLIVGAGIGILLLLLTVVGALAGSAGIALALLIAIPAAIWISIRTVMAAPVIAIEDQRNPFEALKRSWALTNGAAGRLLLFFFLLGISLVVISLVLTSVPGLLVAAVAGEEAATIYAAVAGSVVSAIFSLISAAVLTAIHGQLSHDPATVFD